MNRLLPYIVLIMSGCAGHETASKSVDGGTTADLAHDLDNEVHTDLAQSIDFTQAHDLVLPPPDLDGCCVTPQGIVDCRGPNDAGDSPAHPAGSICYPHN